MALNLPLPPQQGMTAETYSYLFQMAQLLNIAIDSLDSSHVEKVVKQEANEQPSSNVIADETYASLKSLIVKTADNVTATQITPLQQELAEKAAELQGAIGSLVETVASLSGEYVAISDFGTYLEKINTEIAVSQDSITQYYSFIGELTSEVLGLEESLSTYKTETGGYIQSGIVAYEDDGITPIFGVAVGQSLKAKEVNGENVIEPVDFRATFTATKLTFWQDEDPVAYVSGSQLYIPGTARAGGLQLGFDENMESKWDISTSNGLAFKWIGG